MGLLPILVPLLLLLVLPLVPLLLVLPPRVAAPSAI